jgi:hypothetical protein
MFVRVKQYMAENAADFPAGSIGAVQAAEMNAVVDLLDQLGSDQSAGFGDARFSFAGKKSARENVRDDLSEINQTARSMNYQFPNIAEKFRMPRGNNDQQLLAAARAFLTEATPHKTDFIAYGMPADFLDDLQADIEAFEAALGATGEAVDSHVEATAEIDEAIRRGMIAVRILNGVVKNIYRNNVGKLAAWTSASHIEKAPKKEAEPAPTA